MQYNEIFKKLNTNIPSAMAKFQFINSGGCGVVALELARSLRASSIACDIVFVNISHYTREAQDTLIDEYDAADINELIHVANDMINNDDEYGAEIILNGHIVVKIGNSLFDARGDVSNRYDAITDAINDEAMQVLIDQDEFWNNAFINVHGDELCEIISTIHSATEQSLA